MQNQSTSDIKERFTYLAIEVFGLSLEKYLLANQNRLLFGYAIDLSTRSYLPLFGSPPAQLTSEMNKRFIDAMAGYAVAVQTVFPIQNLNADILLVSTKLTSASENDLDTILIHELCHLILDSNSAFETVLSINEETQLIGNQLYSKTDQENQHRTKHGIQFCNLLAAAADKYATLSTALTTRQQVLDAAMRFDLFPNAPT